MTEEKDQKTLINFLNETLARATTEQEKQPSERLQQMRKSYNRVEVDELEHVFVSTVRLKYGDQEYETMVFPKDSWLDVDVDRYVTLEKAQEGHRKMVESWKNRMPHRE